MGGFWQSVKMSWYIKYCGMEETDSNLCCYFRQKEMILYLVNALRKFAREKSNQQRKFTSCEYVYLPEPDMRPTAAMTGRWKCI